MDGNDKFRWWRMVGILLLIIVPVAAVIVLLFLLNKDSKREFTINVQK